MLAASAGNRRMKKRVNSGKPHVGNPEPSPPIIFGVEGAETRHSLPKSAVVCSGHGKGIVRLSEQSESECNH